MIAPISRRGISEEKIKELLFSKEQERLTEEINSNLLKLNGAPVIKFEVWGYSAKEIIQKTVEQFEYSGWDISVHVWYSFGWRADIKIKL